jgi:signal transduction histidine kinase
MSLNPEVLLRLLHDQRPPADAITSIFDGNGLIIARTVDSERLVGLPAAPALAATIAASKEGSGRGHTREGMAVAQAFTRSTLTGWTTWVALSEASAAAATNRAILLLAGGTGVALLVGLTTAVILGKRVSAPISTLAGAAGAMARGESVDLNVAAVREVEELRAALVTAAQAVRDGAAEHEQRVVAEIRRAEAQSANQAKDDFLAVLSHELRTPINAVYGWARMLQTGDIADGVRARALEAIIRNAHAQVQLIDDLLDVSRIVSGKMRLDARPVDLKSVVEGALDAVRPAADAKGTPLHATLDARAATVGDPDRLQQVVWNLLTNAIKFTPRGGHVQVLLYRATSHVEIVVSDTGQGIAAEMLPAVFNRFWQADTGTTRRHKGLGLGLALVRHLVEAHGGTVTAQSAGEGKGATFIVMLPGAVERTEIP